MTATPKSTATKRLREQWRRLYASSYSIIAPPTQGRWWRVFYGSVLAD